MRINYSVNNAISTFILVIIIVVFVVWRRQRRQTLRQKHNLQRNQRTVHIAQQWLDPVIELVIVGGVIWSDLQHGWLPWLCFLIGGVIGLPIGALRGRFMYVRSIGKSGRIIIERNAAEIGILLVLVAIKLIAHKISAQPTSALNLLVIGLLGISLASSIGRVAYITTRHYQTSSSKED